MEDVAAKVKSIIAEQKGGSIDEIKEEASFADLGFDSLDTVELVMKLEEETDVEIPDTEAEKLKTVKDVIEFVKSHKK
jgi:acyl carrier protein